MHDDRRQCSSARAVMKHADSWALTVNRACAHTVLKPLLPALLLGHTVAVLLQQAMELIVRRTFKHRLGACRTYQS